MPAGRIGAATPSTSWGAVPLRATLKLRALLRDALRRERRAGRAPAIHQRAVSQVLHVDPEGGVHDLRGRGDRVHGRVSWWSAAEKLEDDLQLADCNARFRHYQDCVYFLIVTFSTVGYGDMYPATRLGKGVVVFVLLFVLCFLPSLLSDIAELSDGDDTSAEEQQINAVAALHEAVLDLHEDVEHLAAGFEALGPLAGRGEAKQVASLTWARSRSARTTTRRCATRSSWRRCARSSAASRTATPAAGGGPTSSRRTATRRRRRARRRRRGSPALLQAAARQAAAPPGRPEPGLPRPSCPAASAGV